MIAIMDKMLIIFFFKQKTAYEMRISDWSSDVCSSDLQLHPDIAAEPSGAAILGIGQFLALGGELAAAAIEDIDELKQQRARSRAQHRPLERGGVIAPDDRGGGRRTPVGKADRKSTRLNSRH